MHYPKIFEEVANQAIITLGLSRSAFWIRSRYKDILSKISLVEEVWSENLIHVIKEEYNRNKKLARRY